MTIKKQPKKIGDYEVIAKDNGLYDIVGCEAGKLYGDKVIIKILDTKGNIAWYLYIPSKNLYKKVDKESEEFKNYPARYFGSKKHEEERSSAYGNSFRKITDEIATRFKKRSR